MDAITYTRRNGGFWLIANFAQAASPIRVAYSRRDAEMAVAGAIRGDEELDYSITWTPFQVADARHSPREAASLVAAWLRSQG